jgi:hypothetical protein
MPRTKSRRKRNPRRSIGPSDAVLESLSRRAGDEIIDTVAGVRAVRCMTKKQADDAYYFAKLSGKEPREWEHKKYPGVIWVEIL